MSPTSHGGVRKTQQSIPKGIKQKRPISFFYGFVVTFAVLLGVTWYVSAYKKSNFAEYAMWLAKEKMVNSCDVGDLTIIGDSRAVAGIIPTQLGNNVVNLALGGGSPIEAYFMAKKALACPKRPLAFLYSVSVEHFHEAEPRAFWNSGAISGFYSYQNLEEVRKVSRDFNDLNLFSPPKPYDIESRLKEFLYATSFPGYNFQAMWSDLLSDRRHDNANEMTGVVRSRGQRYFGISRNTNMPVDYAKWSALVFDPVSRYFFEKTLSIAKNADVPVYYVNLPYHESQRPARSGALADSVAGYLGSLERQHLLKVVGEPFPFYGPQYFGDGSHLNPRGAIRFSKSVCLAMPDTLRNNEAVYKNCASGHGMGSLPPGYYASHMQQWNDVALTAGP